MQLLFLEHAEPIRKIDVRIRSPLAGREPRVVAGMELAGFSSEQLQLLYESATVVPDPVEPARPTSAAAGMIERVHQDARPSHMIFCPACCAKLGRADSPAIGYLEACPGCRRSGRIRFAAGGVTIVLPAS
jgi:hypothetical protein